MKYEEAKGIVERAGFILLQEESAEGFEGVERTSQWVSSCAILKLEEDSIRKMVKFSLHDEMGFGIEEE